MCVLFQLVEFSSLRPLSVAGRICKPLALAVMVSAVYIDGILLPCSLFALHKHFPYMCETAGHFFSRVSASFPFPFSTFKLLHHREGL